MENEYQKRDVGFDFKRVELEGPPGLSRGHVQYVVVAVTLVCGEVARLKDEPLKLLHKCGWRRCWNG